MVVGKKGWLRIVESIFGIMIMSGALLFIYGSNLPQLKNVDYIVGLERDALMSLVENPVLRKNILQEIYTQPREFVKEGIPNDYSFILSVCNISTNSCGSSLVPKDKEIYTEEVILSSIPESYDPKILRLFVWFSGKDSRITVFQGS